ncbi:MAG: helix-turn-helix domain-containing protein [Terrimesophilobacter sp.]
MGFVALNDDGPAVGAGRFLTIADAADVLNVSASTVYLLVRSGELPAIQTSTRGQWRIERAQLEAYIEARYEEARRLSLWNQSEFANVLEVAFGSDHIRTRRS